MNRPTAQERRQWDDSGYLVFEDAIRGEQLQRLQHAFDHWAERCKSQWLEQVAAGEATATFYDIPDPLPRDEIFVDIVDHPSYYGYLLELTGDDVIFLAEQVRTVPPWPLSYTGWHPDVPHSSPLHIKVQIYINDVEPGSGEFAYVPASHKATAGPYVRPTYGQSMPGHKRFAGAAGTAVMFDASGWHTAMDNPTGTPRKSIILIYERRTPGRVEAEQHAPIAHLCTTPARRRLFSLAD